MKSFLIAGLLPVLAFTVIEEYYGTWWGLIAGLCFGAGEILWELYHEKKVSKITWLGNGFLIILGGVSLFTEDGIWFKLQISIFEIAMALTLWFFLWKGQNPLLAMVRWQQEKMQKSQKKSLTNESSSAATSPSNAAQIPPDLFNDDSPLAKIFRGISFRLGFFLMIQAGIAAWAAYEWSTWAWAFWKSAGLAISLGIYLLIEVFFIRLKNSRSQK